ncbi:SPARC-related modular calcium-binding protein 1-like [Paramacrobiotus metropolitanus]|uniref:SPARC-related modular calcium-binding protein 1-like n=1 Tax=Paramacrobiotus metropolitanus TaxID=2943436 RepID=UPI0024461796|nr:SPARC-related modular calcium-binding protein 1-like [Paramacrobiotus metropolitanus]
MARALIILMGCGWMLAAVEAGLWEGNRNLDVNVPCFSLGKIRLPNGDLSQGLINSGKCTCRQARLQAGLPQLQGQTRGFQPDCEADGRFTTQQTLTNTGYIWTVDAQGNQISTFGRQNALRPGAAAPRPAVASNPLVGGASRAAQGPYILRPQQFFNQQFK